METLQSQKKFLTIHAQGLVTIHANIPSMHKYKQGRTPPPLLLAPSRVRLSNSFQYIENPARSNSQDPTPFKNSPTNNRTEARNFAKNVQLLF